MADSSESDDSLDNQHFEAQRQLRSLGNELVKIAGRLATAVTEEDRALYTMEIAAVRAAIEANSEIIINLKRIFAAQEGVTLRSVAVPVERPVEKKKSGKSSYPMPTFEYPGKSDTFTNINHFIQRFEFTLAADSFKLNDHWERMIPLCFPDIHLNFLKHSLLDQDFKWDEAKETLRQHFTNPGDVTRVKSEIYNIAILPRETIRSFGDRFLSLVSQAGSNDADWAADLLYMKLPLVYSDAINSARTQNAVLHGNPKFLTTPAKIISYCISLESTRNVQHPNSAPPRIYAPPSAPAPVVKPTSNFKGICKIHGPGHSDSKCRAQHPELAPASPAPPTPAAAPVLRPVKRERDNSDVTCHKCGKKGHYADKCPERRQDTHAKRTTADAPAAGAETEKSSPSTTEQQNSAEEEGYGAVNRIWSELKNPTSSHVARTTTASKKKCLIMHLLLDDVRTIGLLDTGCDVSYISHSFAKRNNFNISGQTTTVRTAIPGMTVQSYGMSDPIEVRYLKRTAKVTFYVIDIDGFDAMIGLDDLPNLGWFGGELSLDFPDAEPPVEDPVMPTVDVDVTPPPAALMTAIDQALVANLAMPTSAYCTMPEAEIDIQTPPDASVYIRQYKLPERVRPAVSDKVKSWLDNHVIERCGINVKFNNPLMAAPKKGVDVIRVCIDPRGLNKISQDDKFPLPMQDELRAKLRGAAIFSALDCKDAFHSLPIRSEHRHKTAFTWDNTVYQFARAPFGLKQIPAKFSRVMSLIFANCSFVAVFMDDIIVFSSSLELHQQHVAEAINLLTANGFRLNRAKCTFGQISIAFLGHVVDSEGLRINPAKLVDCEKWPIPTNGSEMSTFLGLVNYWRDHIPLLASLTAPLESLRSIKTSFGDLWTKEHRETYDRVLKILQQGTMLHHADFSQPFIGASDASGAGIGGCVYQETNDIRRYISFYSRSLSKSERNYSATRRELLAMVWTLRKGRNYFWGAHFNFFTDHAALTYIQTQPNLNAMTLNWFDEFAEFNMSIFHRPGILNILPDALSRLYPITQSPVKFARRLDVVDHYNTVDDVDQQKTMLLEAHLLGHFGADAIVAAIRAKGYNWPNAHRQALEVVRACEKCQKWNVTRRGFHPITSITADMPGDHLAMDLGGPYEVSDAGNIYLFLAVNICTRFVFLRAIPDKSSVTVAKALLDYTCTFGFPKIVQSDNGAEFVNKIMTTLKTNSGIEERLSTPYHPQANGAAERWVQTTLNGIRKSIDGVRKDWDLYVPAVMYATNLKVTARHGSTPFSLFFARSPNGFKDYNGSQDLSQPFDQEGYLRRLAEFTKVIFPAINERTQLYLDATNKSGKSKANFPNGCFVMATNKNRANKFEPRYEGPFKVVRRNNGGAYVLQDTDGTIMSRNYTPGELKIVSHDPDTHGKSFDVAAILNHRGKAPKYEYFVQWKGYDATHNTWEPASSFDDIAVINRYWDKQKESRLRRSYVVDDIPGYVADPYIRAATRTGVPENADRGIADSGPRANHALSD